MTAADLFKELVWEQLVEAAKRRLFAFLPILGWGPIGWVVSWLVSKYTSQLFEGVRMNLEIQAIAIKNDVHRKAYDQASVALAIIAREKGIQSPEFKKLREEHKKALSVFAQFAA